MVTGHVTNGHLVELTKEVTNGLLSTIYIYKSDQRISQEMALKRRENDYVYRRLHIFWSSRILVPTVEGSTHRALNIIKGMLPAQIAGDDAHISRPCEVRT